MQHLCAGETGTAEIEEVVVIHGPRARVKSLMVFTSVALALSLTACKTAPTIDEQKSHILSGDLRTRTLTTRAFLETWGNPTYQVRERMQFYPVKNGNYVPRFRVPIGEAPADWDSTVVTGDSLFFGYADRGELLGFINDRLVYSEAMSAEEVHAIGNMWKRESLFKTPMEKGLPSPSAP
jgi:hypothetical protein